MNACLNKRRLKNFFTITFLQEFHQGISIKFEQLQFSQNNSVWKGFSLNPDGFVLFINNYHIKAESILCQLAVVLQHVSFLF